MMGVRHLFSLSLLLLSGCMSFPEGEKLGSLVDSGPVPAGTEETGITMAESDNAFAGDLQIFQVENGFAYSGKALRITGKKVSPEFRNMLEESGFRLCVKGYDLILLNLVGDTRRTIQLQYPDGRVLLRCSYQIRK